MDYNQALTKVEDLLTRIEFGEPNREKREPRFIYGAGEFALVFRGAENVTAFLETVDYFWKKDKELFETITQKMMQEKLVQLIRSCVMENENTVSLDLIKEMVNGIKSEPVQTFNVLYHVYGAEYDNEYPLEIGPYTIYNTDIHRKFLLEKHPHSKDTLDFELDENNISSKVMIGVDEKARDSEKAKEKAVVRLRQFEDTIRFMIGDTNKNYDVGIFNFNYLKHTKGIILSDRLCGSTSELSGTIDNILLHNFPLDAPDHGQDKLWEMLGKENPNQLEKRIISAIAWAGKALRDEEPARALTQYVFALEALHQFQQKGAMVSPSITYQMSEFAAFILNDSLDGRMEIEKLMKDIYAKRSAIAHGGSHNVDENILHEAYALLKGLIITFTSNEEFQDFKTIEEVGEWVKVQKYS